MSLCGKWCDSIRDTERNLLIWITLVGSTCNHMYLYKREGNVKMGADIGVIRPQAKDTSRHQKLEEAKSMLEVFGESVVLPVP